MSEIDITKCPWFNDNCCDLFYSDLEQCWYRKCEDTPNCYYKKTQTEFNRHRQAFNDISEICKKACREAHCDCNCENCFVDEIKQKISEVQNVEND